MHNVSIFKLEMNARRTLKKYELLDLINVTVPLLLGGGLPTEKAVNGEYNLPLRMHGRPDDDVIDQPTLFKHHV
jgi:hypothetical protein